jgi:hypothetical protein
MRLIHSVTEWLKLYSRGAFEVALNEALRNALQTLSEIPSEKGKATIVVKLELNYQKGMLQLTPSMQVKLPEAQAFGPEVAWVHEGALSMQHPTQIDLEDSIREVSSRQIVAG